MSEQACEHCGVYPGFRHWSDCPLHGPADGKPYEPTRTPSPVVSDEVVETVGKAIEREFYACVDEGPPKGDGFVRVARAALEASGYAALKADNERMKEALVALADGADKCAEAPHFIVQPFLNIYKVHGETIAEARNARTILQEVSRP